MGLYGLGGGVRYAIVILAAAIVAGSESSSLVQGLIGAEIEVFHLSCRRPCSQCRGDRFVIAPYRG